MREKRALKKNKMDERADAYVDLLIARKVFKFNTAGNIVATKKFKKHMKRVLKSMKVYRPTIKRERQFPIDDVVGCSLVVGVQDFLQLDKALGVSRKELAKSGGVLCFFLSISSDWDEMKAYLNTLDGMRER